MTCSRWCCRYRWNTHAEIERELQVTVFSGRSNRRLSELDVVINRPSPGLCCTISRHTRFSPVCSLAVNLIWSIWLDIGIMPGMYEAVPYQARLYACVSSPREDDLMQGFTQTVYDVMFTSKRSHNYLGILERSVTQDRRGEKWGRLGGRGANQIVRRPCQ